MRCACRKICGFVYRRGQKSVAFGIFVLVGSTHLHYQFDQRFFAIAVGAMDVLSRGLVCGVCFAYVMSLRCPHCGSSVLLKRNVDQTSWRALSWRALLSNRCPSCGNQLSD